MSAIQPSKNTPPPSTMRGANEPMSRRDVPVAATTAPAPINKVNPAASSNASLRATTLSPAANAPEPWSTNPGTMAASAGKIPGSRRSLVSVASLGACADEGASDAVVGGAGGDVSARTTLRQDSHTHAQQSRNERRGGRPGACMAARYNVRAYSAKSV